MTPSTAKSSRGFPFLAEIEMEITRGRATYAEVEESKADRTTSKPPMIRGLAQIASLP